MFKYSRMQKKVSSWLVCGPYGVCLDYILPGVQVTTGLGFFLHLSHLCGSEDHHSLLYRPMAFLAGP